MSGELPPKRIVAYYAGGTSAELDALPLSWFWDEYPLAPGSWGNIQAFYDGADRRPLIRKWIDRRPMIANPLPLYRPADAPLPPFFADGGVRQCYLPTDADIERVRRLFPDHPRPEAPPWNEVATRLMLAGHKPTELAGTRAPVLLVLLEQQAEAGGEVAAAAVLPTGFLGGESLADVLGIHPERRNAFFRRLGRERLALGDANWQEVQNPKPNAPRFLYRADAPRLQALAAAYRAPKLA